MANVNAPHGLQPVQDMSGRPYTGGANLYYIPTSDATNAYYVGDVVTTIGANNSDANGVPAVTKVTGAPVAAATQIRGVIVGIMVAPIGVGAGQSQGNAVNLNVQFVPVAKAQPYYVLVADDPDLIFEIQADNVSTLANTQINRNASFTSAATQPGTVNGPLSITTLASASIGAGATLPLKIVGMPYRPNVDFTANAPLLVVINVHELQRAPGSASS